MATTAKSRLPDIELELPPALIAGKAAGAAATAPLPAEAERRLPFAFAKRHGVLVLDFIDGQAQVLVRSNATPLSITEVRRFIGMPLKMQLVDAEAFDALLQETYERESNSTMQMVEGLGDDTDLFLVAQQLPEPSDLMESDDDAPIIRLINAVLTSAVRKCVGYSHRAL